MSNPELFQGIIEHAAHETKEAQETLINDHTDTYQEAEGTAAKLKEEEIKAARYAAMDESGPNTDVTLDHE